MPVNHALGYRRFGEPEQVLTLEAGAKAALAAGCVRVKMHYAPVNASDLIPVTGAYRHRIALPQVAGYEGVGVVVEAHGADAALVGKRVLALRGEGTWQSLVDCPADRAILVPDDIDSTLAARGYINPLAAQLMIEHFSPAGKHLLLTAAGTDCALLAGQWAQQAGALSVTGIYRSPVHAARLEACGITPVQQSNAAAVRRYAARAERVYDATGGALAEAIREAMPASGLFISYGLLSGQPFRLRGRYRRSTGSISETFFPRWTPLRGRRRFRASGRRWRPARPAASCPSRCRSGARPWRRGVQPEESQSRCCCSRMIAPCLSPSRPVKRADRARARKVPSRRAAHAG